MQYIKFEPLQVTLCLAAYVQLEALHRIRPVLFSLGQYLQLLVLQGLLT